MQVYDYVTAMNGHTDGDEWIAIELSQEDRDNIREGEKVLLANPVIDTVTIRYTGKCVMDKTCWGIQRRILCVSRQGTIFSTSTEWDGGDIEVDISNEPASEWVWDEAAGNAVRIYQEEE